MSFRAIRPITNDEFARMLSKCKPLTGWSDTIAVGNSGGPDSTCLLFLLNRYISQNSNTPNVPRRVVSLHVNHGLQTASDSMAERCAETAKSIGVEHRVLKIPWSESNYPDLPKEGPIEHVARRARFRTFFQGMIDTKANVIALGHHMDDQVETSLMRIIKGSTEDGAAGMKFCRRWGMDFGYVGIVGHSGYEGMRRWIVRPFLEVSKDRLVATCEENNLQYVTDETNFQPDMTLRNALRQWVKSGGKQTESERHKLDLVTLQDRLEAMESMNVDFSSGPKQIYSAVQALASKAEDIDNEVDFILMRNALHSPAGTYLITRRSLAPITDDRVRRSLALRILRYASFHPWGSLAAQVNRRASSLTQIIEKVWAEDPFSLDIKPFCAGGGVLWTPVAIQGNQFRIALPTPSDGKVRFRKDESFGWLASRQPPLSRERLASMGAWNPLRSNIKSLILSKLAASGRNSTLEVLYDSRFLVTVDFATMPTDILELIQDPENTAGIWLIPNTRWYWPKVVLLQRGHPPVVLHSAVTTRTDVSLFPGLTERTISNWEHVYWRRFDEEITAPWIQVEFVRPITTM